MFELDPPITHWHCCGTLDEIESIHLNLLVPRYFFFFFLSCGENLTESVYRQRNTITCRWFLYWVPFLIITCPNGQPPPRPVVRHRRVVVTAAAAVTAAASIRPLVSYRWTLPTDPQLCVGSPKHGVCYGCTRSPWFVSVKRCMNFGLRLSPWLRRHARPVPHCP